MNLSLKSKSVIILPHGVLFRRNKEADIRNALIQRGLIKWIIGLPANLFYGTGITACIVVIDEEDADERRDPETGGMFVIDVIKGFLKDGKKPVDAKPSISRSPELQIADVASR